MANIRILLVVLIFGLGSTAQQQKSEDILLFKPADLSSLKSAVAAIDCSPLAIKGQHEEWGHAKACDSFKELIVNEDRSALGQFGDSVYACPGPLDTLFLVGGILHPSQSTVKNKFPGFINITIYKNGINKEAVMSEGVWEALSLAAPSTYKYHGQPPAILKEKFPNLSFYLDVNEDQIISGSPGEQPWFVLQRSTGRYIAKYKFLGNEQLSEDGKCFRFEHQFVDADKGIWQIAKN